MDFFWPVATQILLNRKWKYHSTPLFIRNEKTNYSAAPVECRAFMSKIFNRNGHWPWEMSRENCANIVWICYWCPPSLLAWFWTKSDYSRYRCFYSNMYVPFSIVHQFIQCVFVRSDDIVRHFWANTHADNLSSLINVIDTDCDYIDKMQSEAGIQAQGTHVVHTICEPIDVCNSTYHKQPVFIKYVTNFMA